MTSIKFLKRLGVGVGVLAIVGILLNLQKPVEANHMTPKARLYSKLAQDLGVAKSKANAMGAYFEAQMAKPLAGKYYCAPKTSRAAPMAKALASAQIRGLQADVDLLVELNYCAKLKVNHNYNFLIIELVKVDGKIVAIASNIDVDTTGIAKLPIVYMPE